MILCLFTIEDAAIVFYMCILSCQSNIVDVYYNGSPSVINMYNQLVSYNFFYIKENNVIENKVIQALV